jgi:hypothetical protein
MKNTLKLLLIVGMVASLAACNDSAEEVLSHDEALTEAEDLIARSTEETASGRKGCFELVFPITIDHPDGTSSEVMTWQEGKEAMVAWRTANPDVSGRSQLQYPIELVLGDGSVVSVENRAERRELRRECRKDRIEDRRGQRCFTLIFPVEVSFPDGQVDAFDDRRTMKQGLRQWRRSNRGSADRPSLVYPITVELEDGTTVEVESKEDLASLKEDCAG